MLLDESRCDSDSDFNLHHEHHLPILSRAFVNVYRLPMARDKNDSVRRYYRLPNGGIKIFGM